MSGSIAEAVRAGSDATVPPVHAPSPAARQGGPRPAAGGRLRPSQAPPGAVPVVARRLAAPVRPSAVPASPAIPASPASPVLDVLRASGQPLPAPAKDDMEARFGADLSGVRLHTGAAARESAAAIGARAYTAGVHVVIGAGGADEHTLAHELAHVIQQRSGPVPAAADGRGLRLSDPDHPFERAAESAAARAMSGAALDPPAAAAMRAPVPPGRPPGPAPAAQAGPVVQRMRRVGNFGYSNQQMTKTQFQKSGMATNLSLIFETADGVTVDIGTMKSNKSVTFGDEHAEDVALRLIQEHIDMFAGPPARNRLILSLSKSPCTSTVRLGLPTTSNKGPGVLGCTEELINLATNGITHNGITYLFELIINCRGLYAPSPATQAILQASQAAADAINATPNLSITGDERPAAREQRYEMQ